MKNISNILLLMFLLIAFSCKKQSKETISYFEIEKMVVVDSTGNTIMTDYYRNMEQLKDSTVIKWFQNQGKLTNSIVKEINQENDIYKSILTIESKASKDIIIERYIYADNGAYYILKRHKEEKIAKLYYRSLINSEEELLIDPETLQKGASINYIKISPTQNKIAFAIALKGSENSTIYVLDTKSKEILTHHLPEVMPRMAGGINWLPDDSGFFYSKFPHLDPKKITYLESSMSYIHYIDEPYTKDREIFSMQTNPELNMTVADFPMVQTRKDNPTILLGRISGTSSYKDMYYSEIINAQSIENPKWIPLFKQSDQISQYIIKGDSIYYLTSKNASNFKICKALIGSDYSKGENLVKEKESLVIVDFDLVNNTLYYSTIKNGVEAHLIKVINKKEEEIALPFSAGSCYVRAVNNNLMVSVTGWVKPTENYLYKTDNKEFLFVDLNKSLYPEFKDFIVEEVEVISHDGEKIPLSIIRHPDTKLDGSNRVKINAYGAYGSSSSPYLEISSLNWVKSGNIYAVAHVRGGGEKGDAWHKAGFKTTKSNSWKDFIACTEYLIDNKYTNPERTIAFGVSAGGITIGNALVERPDLYQVGLLFSGFVNATRSEFQPNGANSKKEFGALAIEEEAKGLVEMDAYLKIKENVSYPAIYAFVGLEDGQVAAWDSGKFVARLQNDAITKGPVLLEVDEDGGHGGGGTAHDSYQIVANMDAFALWQTGHPDYQLKE
ncbi:prolyl oligopeptidase family serine peptidase [uncultured Dokdonia sp.]|uniref:prolyl oligopeptidase family serine peptidase n=1 Tax=uncultured Dokdonia sp. TaxID=575653 RepID=UPI00261DAE66|nr:prolyl oligopeptidase family serine peptidase [uncultured Dokdonia sp.]